MKKKVKKPKTDKKNLSTVQVKPKKPKWSDAGILMKKATTPAKLAEQQMIIALSVAYDIPPQGVTILADNPYINKIGLEFIFNRHKTGKRWSHFISEPVELAKGLGETAVFVTKLYNEDGRVIANGFGSANSANIKMSTIKVFLNEMAETRSQNRCLRKVLSPILYQTFIENIRRLDKNQRKVITDVGVDFGSVTAEEMTVSDEEVKPEKLLTEGEMKDIAGFLQEMTNAKDQKALTAIGARIKAGVKIEKFNKRQADVLREAWSGKSQKLAFK